MLRENANLDDKISVRFDWENSGDVRSSFSFEKAARKMNLEEEPNYSEYVASPEEDDDYMGHTGFFYCTVGDLKKIIEDYDVDPESLYVVQDGKRVYDVNSLIFDADPLNESNYKNIKNILREAKKPSSSKMKYRNDTHTATFKNAGGFDGAHMGTYEDTETYHHGDGTGYIMDKEGNVYDVVAKDREGDSGYISGGAHDYSVIIRYKDGINLKFSGYTALFSTGHGTDIISDLDHGYYLEDYCAKHEYDFEGRHDDSQIFKELAAKGDPNAKSFDELKREKAAASNEKKLAKNSEKYDYTFDGYFSNKETYPEVKLKIEEGSITTTSKMNTGVIAFLEPFIQDLFQGRDFGEFEGLSFELTFTSDPKNPRYRKMLDNSRYAAISKETGDIIIVEEDVNKYGGITYRESKAIYNASIFNFDETPLGKAILKFAETHRQDDRFNDQMFDIYGLMVRSEKDRKLHFVKDTRGYYSADSMSKHKFKEILELFPESSKELNALNRRAASFDTNTDTRSFAKHIKASKNLGEAESKMDAWHNGERRQNVKACSDEKLKAYYSICKNKGYKAEMEA